jgi:hypothetical protein
MICLRRDDGDPYRTAGDRVKSASLSRAWWITSVGRSVWWTTAFETLPSSIERRPVSPREPITIAAA